MSTGVQAFGHRQVIHLYCRLERKTFTVKSYVYMLEYAALHKRLKFKGVWVWGQRLATPLLGIGYRKVTNG